MEYETIFIGVAEPTPPTTQPNTTETTSLTEAFVDPVFDHPEVVAIMGTVAIGLAVLARFAKNRANSWQEIFRDR